MSIPQVHRSTFGRLPPDYSDSVVSIRPWGIASAAVGLISSGIYVGVIASEGNNTLREVAPWAGMMLAASVVMLVGAVVPRPSVAKAALLVAIALFAVVGFLALFSIGLLFVAAAGLGAVTYTRVEGEKRDKETQADTN